MNIENIERQLAEAEERARAISIWSQIRDPEGWQKYVAAKRVVLGLQRELAAAKGEEYAFPIDFPVLCERGAPMPQLLRNDYRCFLIFHLDEPDPKWDGTYVTVKDPAAGETWPLALVEFFGCVSARLGWPNEDQAEAHPLMGRGHEDYIAQKVMNSRWLAELDGYSKSLPHYRPENWQNFNHYVFWFHDTTFECIAESFKVETYNESMRDLLARVCERMLT